jgi:methionine-rich copper-binding protein CopC
MAGRRTWHGLALLALIPLLVISGGVSAHAHAQLLVSNPRIGATLYKAPTAVVLTFDDDLIDLAGGNEIVVLDPRKHQVQNGLTQLNGATLKTPLKKVNLYGKYTVIYKVMSVDGHPVTSKFLFYLAKKKKK